MLADYSTSTFMDSKQLQHDNIPDLLSDSYSRVFLFVGKKSAQLCHEFKQCGMFQTSQLLTLNGLEEATQWLQTEHDSTTTTALICDATYAVDQLRTLKKKLIQYWQGPLILYNDQNVDEYRNKVVSLPLIAEDFLYSDLGLSNIKERIIFLSELKKLEQIKQISQDSRRSSLGRSIPKRAFDITVALVCIVLVSPLLLLIIIAIKLESEGPVFFISERAGAGYKIFNFYKFRTMQSNANQMRNDLKTLNTYYAKDRDPVKREEPFFFKVKNDPRVTRVGRILRKTSLDELPQLFNVLKGDMSLVGNRPLPLDEGATLTIDHWADRFLAPAGMTGLWQIAKNKDNMSVSERIDLDLEYVKHNSFLLDMEILFKTIPAMLQRD